MQGGGENYCLYSINRPILDTLFLRPAAFVTPRLPWERWRERCARGHGHHPILPFCLSVDGVSPRVGLRSGCLLLGRSLSRPAFQGQLKRSRQGEKQKNFRLPWEKNFLRPCLQAAGLNLGRDESDTESRPDRASIACFEGGSRAV